MARTLTISIPPADYEFIKSALDHLAEDVISDDEAGQRGAKRSILIRMLAVAYIANVGETTRLTKKIKKLINGNGGNNEK